MLAWLQNFALGGAAGSAVLSGDLSDGVLENELFSTWQYSVIQVSGNTWATGTTFNDGRAALIQGFDSDGVELGGWNNEVRDKLSVASVTRVSDETVSIIFPPSSGFTIDANETVTLTIPPSILSGFTEIVATPTFVVTADTLSGTEIVNADTSTAEPTNYEQCDRSGFRQWPGELIRNWDNVYTRRKSVDERHPQLMIKSVSENLKGSVSPEGDDTFLTEDVKAEDL